MFKKLFFIAVLAVCVCSCSSVKYATSVDYSVKGGTPALMPLVCDLQVADAKVSYTYSPVGKEAKVLSLKKMQEMAVYYAIEKAGADVLVHPNYLIDTKYGMGGVLKKVRSITVTGYPAKYVNFRTTTQDDAKILDDLNNPSRKTAVKKNIQIQSTGDVPAAKPCRRVCE